MSLHISVNLYTPQSKRVGPRSASMRFSRTLAVMIISTHLKSYLRLGLRRWENKRQLPNMSHDAAKHLLRNNVPEVLRLALREPVTVVKDGRQIACIISVPAFAEAGGS